jgi:Leucine-rich repeat (LRR) protein
MNITDEEIAQLPDWLRTGLGTWDVTPDETDVTYTSVVATNAGLKSQDLSLLASFPYLRVLSITENKAVDDIGLLAPLRYLTDIDVSSNGLRRILGFPAPIALRTAIFDKNDIKSMNDIHEDYGASLAKLSVSSNLIRQIAGLDHLTVLVDLDLSHNEIQRISGLEGLRSLTRLNLSHNKIQTVTNLEPVAGTLQELRLHNNNITNLDGISCCKHLLIVDLQVNALKMFEDILPLAHLPLLHTLVLSDNPFVFSLDYYRYDVLHCIPMTSSLDGVEVTPEEKVKAEIHYGADQDVRADIRRRLSKIPEVGSHFSAVLELYRPQSAL